MTSEYQQWQKLKNNYLKQVEHALASINHPKNTDVLHDVDEHLERKYAELPPDKQNWEGFQQILIEMGPPQDYAELLAEETLSTQKGKFSLNELLAVVFIIVLIAIGGYLIYTAQKTSMRSSTSAAHSPKAFEFEPDEQVLGKWLTIDFVKTIDDFNPNQKQWPGELFLNSLDFEDEGVLWWTNIDGGPYKHQWTNGKVDPLEDRPALYYLQNIDGQTYLFYEWVSGDVTIRGKKPCYYVLTQNPEQAGFNIEPPVLSLKRNSTEEQSPQSIENMGKISVVEPPLISEPSILGKWRVVDCVKNIEDFDPDRPTYKKPLLLKELHFTSPQILYWIFNNNLVKETSFTKDTLETVKGQPAKYFLNVIDEREYLFIEWITPEVVKERKEPDYYVLIRPPQSCRLDDVINELPGQNLVINNNQNTNPDDTDIVGQWVSVDFVKTISDFQPDKKQWAGDLYLKNLTIYDDGTTSGPWTRQGNTLWHPSDKTHAHLTVQSMQGATYLFMEWMSGDVIYHGQKPAYYVLKKNNTISDIANQNRKITIKANYCTANYVRSILGTPTKIDSGGRMLRYTNNGFDLWFFNNGPLSEVHLNKGYTGQLKTGISLNSTKQEVFAIYGQPTQTVQASDLHGKNDERVLCQKGNISRIYYGRHGLIFWFKDDFINQIVVFKGTLTLE